MTNKQHPIDSATPLDPKTHKLIQNAQAIAKTSAEILDLLYPYLSPEIKQMAQEKTRAANEIRERLKLGLEKKEKEFWDNIEDDGDYERLLSSYDPANQDDLLQVIDALSPFTKTWIGGTNKIEEYRIYLGGSIDKTDKIEERKNYLLSHKHIVGNDKLVDTFYNRIKSNGRIHLGETELHKIPNITPQDITSMLQLAGQSGIKSIDLGYTKLEEISDDIDKTAWKQEMYDTYGVKVSGPNI